MTFPLSRVHFITVVVCALIAAGGPAPAQTPDSMQAAYVRGVQKELLAHGYNAGPIDGVAGPRTRNAVRAYQEDAGLSVDGRADKRLLDHLKFALPKVYAFGAPVIGHVLDAQRALAERGYYLGPHDGIDGPATQRALRWFQTDAQLPRDDNIDSRTVQQIRDAPPDVTAETLF